MWGNELSFTACKNVGMCSQIWLRSNHILSGPLPGIHRDRGPSETGKGDNCRTMCGTDEYAVMACGVIF
jgi:hypothetical protein